MNTISITMMHLCGFGLNFRLDGFRLLYVAIAILMWACAMAFSTEYMAHHRNQYRYYLFSVVTCLATVGVFLSADLFTTFVFFEIMSLSSYVWVVQEETAVALRAGDTYLAIAIIGGLAMLMGIFLLYHLTGTTEITTVGFDGTMLQFVAGLLMLFGFGAKAGAFPLHIWLPKAHPVAPAPASALLSGILTKTGIFGILLLSCNLFYGSRQWGTLILFLGVLTMFTGALLALFSVDLKRTLACSSVSQIGFILTGIGCYDLLGNAGVLAARGTLMHMVNHSMLKLLLFLAAGVVYMNLHALDLNEIRGFGRKKKLLHFQFLMGALGISGIPLWNGYVSKSLLHEGIVECAEVLAEARGLLTFAEWIFIISGGMTIAYMTKLYVALFLEKNRDEAKQNAFDEKKRYMNPLSAISLMIPALFMPLAGLLPHSVADRIMDFGQDFLRVEAMEEQVRYFSANNLIGASYSILIGAVLYFVVVRKCLMKDGAYVNRWPKYLDLEEYFYRPLLLSVLPAVCTFFCRILDKATDLLVPVLLSIAVFFCRIADRFLDFLVVVLRKTVYKEERLPQERIEGTVFSHFFGGMADRITAFLNETAWEYHPHQTDREHRLAMLSTRLSENNAIIARSLSFALSLAGVGLILVVLFMLL